MARIFKDVKRKEGKVVYERPIIVEERDGLCVLTLEDVAGIFPALHYLESYPDSRKLHLKIRNTGKIMPQEGDEVEEFVPDLNYDSREKAYGYKNYNFILLNNEFAHQISGVIGEFSAFLSEIRNPKKRKIKIKDMPPELYGSVRRVAEAKKQYGRGDFYFKESNMHVNDVPAAAYIYAERFSPGLRRRMGITGKMRESNLEERLVLK